MLQAPTTHPVSVVVFHFLSIPLCLRYNAFILRCNSHEIRQRIPWKCAGTESGGELLDLDGDVLDGLAVRVHALAGGRTLDLVRALLGSTLDVQLAAADPKGARRAGPRDLGSLGVLGLDRVALAPIDRLLDRDREGDSLEDIEVAIHLAGVRALGSDLDPVAADLLDLAALDLASALGPQLDSVVLRIDSLSLGVIDLHHRLAVLAVIDDSARVGGLDDLGLNRRGSCKRRHGSRQQYHDQQQGQERLENPFQFASLLSIEFMYIGNGTFPRPMPFSIHWEADTVSVRLYLETYRRRCMI